MTQAEPAAFADFYAATFHRVAAQLNAYLGDRAEAQDLTQEAFCRALGRWDRISRYENPEAWVRQVAWNLATSRLRHLQVMRRFVSRHREEHEPAPGPERIDLTRALAALPPNHRLAVVLHHVGQLSTSEIAGQEGVAEGTVRSWLSRGRAQLAEELVDWEQADTVAPPVDGLDGVAARARKRRAAKRAIVAAILAVLVAIPAAFLLSRRHREPEPIQPSPIPRVMLPAPEVEHRTVLVPGGVRDHVLMTFIDADHGWAYQRGCHQACWMVRTTDGARTWQQIALPPLPVGGRGGELRVISEQVFFLAFEEAGFWLTTDGGKTFQHHPLNAAPPPVLTSYARHWLVCPGAAFNPFYPYDEPNACERRDLIEVVGGKPVAVQPPLRRGEVHTGADGTIWIVDVSARRIVHSEDGVRTWRELPWPPVDAAGRVAYVTFSPDSGKPGLIAERRDLWEFDEGRWVNRTPLGDVNEYADLIGDGLWMVLDNKQPGFRTGGKYYVVAGVTDTAGVQTVGRDGTIVVHAGDEGLYLLTGRGMERKWVRVAHGS